MKTVVTALALLTMLGASAADARPMRHHHRHQVCHWQHHHRVCHWR